MFTGLVEKLVSVAAVEHAPPGKRIELSLGEICGEIALGESIAMNGCCLTVVRVDTVRGTAAFEAGPETLARTNLGRLQAGSVVNIERSLRVGDRMGGHFVTGHVDGVGHLRQRHDDNDWSTFWFAVPPELARQMASKGSVTVDGVSLTLVDVADDQFSVALIPHTLSVTTLGKIDVGDPVNIETDVLAKYVQKIFDKP
jgi:riboflavin synthase